MSTRVSVALCSCPHSCCCDFPWLLPTFRRNPPGAVTAREFDIAGPATSSTFSTGVGFFVLPLSSTTDGNSFGRRDSLLFTDEKMMALVPSASLDIKVPLANFSGEIWDWLKERERFICWSFCVALAWRRPVTALKRRSPVELVCG